MNAKLDQYSGDEPQFLPFTDNLSDGQREIYESFATIEAPATYRAMPWFIQKELIDRGYGYITGPRRDGRIVLLAGYEDFINKLMKHLVQTARDLGQGEEIDKLAKNPKAASEFFERLFESSEQKMQVIGLLNQLENTIGLATPKARIEGQNKESTMDQGVVTLLERFILKYLMKNNLTPEIIASNPEEIQKLIDSLPQSAEFPEPLILRVLGKIKHDSERLELESRDRHNAGA